MKTGYFTKSILKNVLLCLFACWLLYFLVPDEIKSAKKIIREFDTENAEISQMGWLHNPGVIELELSENETRLMDRWLKSFRPYKVEMMQEKYYYTRASVVVMFRGDRRFIAVTPHGTVFIKDEGANTGIQFSARHNERLYKEVWETVLKSDWE